MKPLNLVNFLSLFTMKTSLLHRLLVLLKWILLGFIIIFILTVVIFNLPPVQRRLAHKVNEVLKNKGLPVSVEEVTLLLTGKIRVQGLEIMGSADDTIARLGKLYVTFNPIPLLVHQIKVNGLSIENAKVLLKQDEVAGQMNIATVFSKNSSSKEKKIIKDNPGKKKAWKIKASKVNIENVLFSMNTTGDSMFISLFIDRFKTTSLSVSFSEKKLEAGKITLENSKAALKLGASKKLPKNEKESLPWNFHVAGIILGNDSITLDFPLKQQRFEVYTGTIVTGSNRASLKDNHFEVDAIRLDGTLAKLFSEKRENHDLPSKGNEINDFLPEELLITLNKARIRNVQFETGKYSGLSQTEDSGQEMIISAISANINSVYVSRSRLSATIKDLAARMKGYPDLKNADIDFLSDPENKTSLDFRLKTENSSVALNLFTPVLLKDLIAGHALPEDFKLSVQNTRISLNDIIKLTGKNNPQPVPGKYQSIEIMAEIEAIKGVTNVKTLVFQIPGITSLSLNGSLTLNKSLSQTLISMNYQTSIIKPESVRSLLKGSGR